MFPDLPLRKQDPLPDPRRSNGRFRPTTAAFLRTKQPPEVRLHAIDKAFRPQRPAIMKTGNTTSIYRIILSVRLNMGRSTDKRA